MSQLEDTLLLQMRLARLPEPEREHRFAAPRRWRFDIAYPSVRLAIEVDGATWSGGRHTRGAGFEADCTKLNQAALRGWLVLRFTRGQVERGEALATIEDMLGRIGATVQIA